MERPRALMSDHILAVHRPKVISQRCVSRDLVCDEPNAFRDDAADALPEFLVAQLGMSAFRATRLSSKPLEQVTTFHAAIESSAFAIDAANEIVPLPCRCTRRRAPCE